MRHRRFRFVIVSAAFVVSAAAFPALPGALPAAWGVPPREAAWLSRLLSAFFLPAVAVFVTALFRVIAARDPQRENHARFRGTFELIVDVAVLFVVGLHVTLLATLLAGARPSLGRVTALLVGISAIVVGNVMPRIRPNCAVGIRTPWTRADERVWRAAHRTGGYVVVGLGLAIVLAAVFNLGHLGWIVASGAGVTALVLVLSSYLLSINREEQT